MPATIRYRIFCFSVLYQKCKKYGLRVFLYGCETWSVILKEGYSLRDFENRALKKILGPMWVKVRGEWRKQHKEELHDFYSTSNITRVIISRRMR
jgi:hypothetical protein